MKKISIIIMIIALFFCSIESVHAEDTINNNTDNKNKTDIKNPETGVFLNYFSAFIIAVLAVLTILVIKRKNKFFKL